MTCEVLPMPGGGAAIVCSRSGPRPRCACGKLATLECDAPAPRRRSGTCDAPICASCATSPAPGKDLCAAHAAEARRWQRELDLGEVR